MTSQNKNMFLMMLLVGLLLTFGITTEALATIPYAGAGGVFPGFGPGVIAPPLVGGKEYSHDLDYSVVLGGPPDTILNPQQIVAWDGTGGVVDATDFSGTRPTYTPDDEIDAIANRRDFAYEELKRDDAHLVFSVDDFFTAYSFGTPFLPPPPPPGTPPGITLANGNVIGGTGELSVELAVFGGANPADTQTLWAKQAEINGMPLPGDIDGVELWGPEPPAADANKYSLDFDSLSGTSVWNASGTPYVAQGLVIAAVMSLLPGPIPTTIELEEAINIDALMVQDVIGDPDRFDPGGGPAAPGPGDEIIFSIRQIPNPADPDGYYATGSELFVLNASAPPAYLAHGGHLWDHAYSLATFEVFGGTSPQDNNYGVLDINAIEAIGEFAVPEPTTFALCLLGLAAIGCAGRRR